MKTPRSIQLACPAKVNLALSVGAPRPDGLHPLASWMAALDFADELTLAQSGSGRSRFKIMPANDRSPHAPPVRVDWPLETDLAYRAHTLMQRHTGRELPVDLELRKRIPAGAGLGGGSSNAAAVTVGLDQLFDLRLDTPTLVSLGRTLGSDVGFLVGAMLGQPSAVVTGVGETIDPVPLRQTIHLVLVFPPYGCPTPDVYRAFDRLISQPDRVPYVSRVQSLATGPSVVPHSLFNDLADAAMTVRPSLRELRDRLLTVAHAPVHVTGSGSTLFTLAPNAAAAQKLAEQVSQAVQLPTIATQTATPQA